MINDVGRGEMSKGGGKKEVKADGKEGKEEAKEKERGRTISKAFLVRFHAMSQ